MIKSSERKLWYAETEQLAERLADKDKYEIQEIFDSHDIYEIRVTHSKIKTSILGRLLFPLVLILAWILIGVKWLITGNSYLTAMMKRFPLLKRIFTYVGLE